MSRAASLATLEDARTEQAGLAARTARRNQPRGLLVVAVVLLVAALMYVGVALSARRTAHAELVAAQAQAERAVSLAGRLQAQKAAAAASPVENQPTTQLRSRIQEAGLTAGLKKQVPLPSTPATSIPQGYGSKQTRWVYTVDDEDLGALLRWMERSVAAVPGLEVYSVSLKPEAHSWQLKVTFSRWEKLEGS